MQPLRHRHLSADSTEIEIVRLTDNGWSVRFKKSSDGIYIAHARRKGGSEIVAAGTTVQWAVKRLVATLITRR